LTKGSGVLIDIGCGSGNSYARNLKEEGTFMVGLDINLPSLKKAEGNYSDLVLADARHLCFQFGSCDVVLASEVMEHLSKEDGKGFLKSLAEIARKRIVLTVPNGYFAQKGALNLFMIHLSAWSREELEAEGFEVIGIRGLRAFGVLEGRGGPFLRAVLFAASIVLLPITSLIPDKSFQLLAYRDLC
jgi:SAM-dependent methyltransferase